MKIPELKGCGTALVTPFFEDGEVDYEAFGALVERQVKGGVDFLVPLGTTAETPTLDPMERVALLDITHDCAAGRPLLVGCGSNSVRGTLAQMQILEGSAADAWLVVVPFYNKPTQEGMYQYYKTIAAESSKPVVMYNVPGRTGVNMLPETAVRIAREIPGVMGIKEASGKLEQAARIAAEAPSDFVVLSGDDDLTLDMMKAGARGVISVASNIVPDKVSALCAAALEGRMDEAEALNEALKPLYKACFVESNPIPAKAALAELGLCTAAMRLPLTPAADSTKELMREVLAGLV
ncbi:MAG: 4-hydroxy-tetrahydrodipicolinate synthase [Bacteroidales bacterium]|nr:4-hydroxy-tetrahydrodipicolinate synthase [Bacteroidales bacterium]